MSGMAAVKSETFGQRVKRIRLDKKIRQTDLAISAGISWRHLIRIEQDAGGVTKPSTVAQLARALGVESEELTGSDDDEEADPAMREAFALFADLMGRLQQRPVREGAPS